VDEARAQSAGLGDPGQARPGGLGTGLRERVRRTYPLAGEMAILVVAVLVWQFLRIPLETSEDRAIAAARRWLDLERALGIQVEEGFTSWLAARPDLREAALFFYSRMDATIAFAALAVLRLLDPRRFPTVRTAFVLAHLPALLVIAAYPMAPPKWLPELPHGSPPPADLGADLINSTAATVSLHVGVPVLLAAAAIWMRPRSPLAWASALYPVVVLWLVLATGNHFVLDALVGGACIAIGWAGARVIHGRVPRSRPEVGPGAMAAAAAACALIVPAVNAVLLRLAA
jgi:hypothetical protein